MSQVFPKVRITTKCFLHQISEVFALQVLCDIVMVKLIHSYMNTILSTGLAERLMAQLIVKKQLDHTGLNRFVMQKAEVSMNVGILGKLPLLYTSS